MSIYKNAIDSIVLGVEDYNSSDSRRLISATRNMTAGILLLVKHKLADLSPDGSDEVLIKQRVLPVMDNEGALVWRGEGGKTVDVQQMKERCEKLGIRVDWKRVDKIVKHRNDVEHYFTSLTHEALRGIIADSFVVIRDFLWDELAKDPLVALGAPTWGSLTKVAEVYAREKAECRRRVAMVNWKFPELLHALQEWRCTKCGSGLIDVEEPGEDKYSAGLICRSCGLRHKFEAAAEGALGDAFRGENFSSMKDAGEPVTIQCPECTLHTYHLAQNICFVCEAQVSRQCSRCYVPIPASEVDGSGICSWCSHMMSKDD